MSVKFNDNLNHTIIVEDVLSDEENDDTFENHFDQEEFNLVKNDDVQNIVQPRGVQYRTMSPYYKPKQPVQRQPPKNQISYDDILKSMNMCVKNGKLERIQPLYQENNYSPQVTYQNGEQPNSYIYNKYFKNYATNQNYESQQIPSRPLTQEERRALMIKRQIEIAQQRKRISEIKSTKLQFSDNNVNVSSVYKHNDLNRLFKMKF
jgi:hypothetical protein